MMATKREGADVLGAVAVVGAFVVLAVVNRAMAASVSDWLAPLLAATAAIFCFGTGLRAGGPARMAWLLLAVAATAWAASEVGAVAYRLAGEGSAPEELSDMSQLIATGAAAIALLLLSPQTRRAASRIADLLDGLLIAASSLFLVWALVVEPYASIANEGIANESILPLASSLGYVVLVSLAIFAASRARPVDRPVLAVLAFSMVAMAVAGTGATALAVSGNASLDVPFEAGWLGGYGLLAIAAQRASGRRYDDDDDKRPSLWRIALPYVPAVAAGAVAVTKLASGSDLDGLLLANAAVIVGLLLARQLALLVDQVEVGAGLEAKVSDRTAGLKSSEERFRALVQNSSDVITLLAADGVVIYQSDAIGRVFGLSPTGLTGKQFSDWVHEADRERLQAVLRDLLRNPGGNDRLIARLQRPDGRWAQVEIEMANLCAEPSVEAVVLNIRDVTDRLILQRRLDHEATFDPLTGVANRRFFTRAIGDAVAQRLIPAVVAVDLDRFQDVNAQFGQEGGDHVLREVAKRLKECVRSTDFVARIGADEFAILVLPGDNGQTDPGRVVARIESMLGEPIALHDESAELTAAIGIAQGSPGQRADEVLTAALAALSSAKERGRGGRAVYDERLAAAQRERLEIAAELREAIRKGDLVFVYQPSVNFAEEDLFAIDAGFRWTHPTRGRLDAIAVLAIAEEAGVVDRLTWWMLEEVCRVGVSWDSRLGRRPISVRVSARHAVSGLVPLVTELVAGTPLPAGGLVLEIAGAGAFLHTADLAAAVTALRETGVKVAIDDLHNGSIRADLSLLDAKLIERSDTDEHAAAMVRALVDLAHACGAQVVADGVSRDSQVELLRSVGCEIGRGSYFGVAVSRERLETALNLLGDAAPQRLPAAGMRIKPLD